VNRQPMPVRASFLGVSAKPNHAAIAALVEAARLSVRHKMFGSKTFQFSHAGQSTLDLQAGRSNAYRPVLSRHVPTG
jgi:hypothetical protein